MHCVHGWTSGDAVVVAVLVTLLLHPRGTAVAQSITSIAGIHNESGWSGNGSAALSALLNYPSGIALRPNGDVIVADTGNHRICVIAAHAGLLFIIAGNGTAGFAGNGDDAAGAMLRSPVDVALNAAGDIYLADTGNHVVRCIRAATGLISTIAGTAAAPGFGGDGRKATLALLHLPRGVTVTISGDVLIADTQNQAVRKVWATSSIIHTVAGLPGNTGFSGDGGLATSAKLFSPTGLAFSEATGVLYIADSLNQRVRAVTASGIITTFAGNGTVAAAVTGAGYTSPFAVTATGAGYWGDLGPAAAAQLDYPTGVAVDAQGRVFVADSVNCAIRAVDTMGVINTVAGNGTCGFRDGGATSVAMLGNVTNLALSADGGFYIADHSSSMIRKYTVPLASPPPALPPAPPPPPSAPPTLSDVLLPPPSLAYGPTPRAMPPPLVLDLPAPAGVEASARHLTGAIVGGVAGGVAALIALLALGVWRWRNREDLTANAPFVSVITSKSSKLHVGKGSAAFQLNFAASHSSELAADDERYSPSSNGGLVDGPASPCGSSMVAPAHEADLLQAAERRFGAFKAGPMQPPTSRHTRTPSAGAHSLPDVSISSLTSSWGNSVCVGVSALASMDAPFPSSNGLSSPCPSGYSAQVGVSPAQLHSQSQLQWSGRSSSPPSPRACHGLQGGAGAAPHVLAPLQTGHSLSRLSSSGFSANPSALGSPLCSPTGLAQPGQGPAGNSPNSAMETRHFRRSAVAMRPKVSGSGSATNKAPDATAELLARIHGHGSMDASSEPSLSPRARKMNVGGVQWTQGALVDSGGFGKVYMGYDHDGALIAIKAQPLPSGADQSAQLLLLSELNALQKLKHRNVVEYLGSAMDDQQLYIFMSYEPQSLAKLLADGLEEEVVRKYTRQILLGLQYVHSQGIYHRDVKAANLLVSSDGVIKLTDFGSAKMRQSTDHGSSIHIQSIAGTPHWMSPEICLAAMGQSPGYSGAKADSWSVGVTVIEMMMGGHPWRNMEGLEAIWKVVNSPEGLPRPPLASPMALDFINLCLQRDATKRGTIAQLLAHPFAVMGVEGPTGLGRRAPRVSQSFPMMMLNQGNASMPPRAPPAALGAAAMSPLRPPRVPARTTSAIAALCTAAITGRTAAGARTPDPASPTGSNSARLRATASACQPSAEDLGL